jgi:SAM-dependent methyltransferase
VSGTWEGFLDDPVHHNLYVSTLVYMPTIKMIRRVAKRGDLILEAGCGSGRAAMLMADMGYRVAAVDRSFTLARRISPAAALLEKLHPATADIGFLPFKKKVFKVSYSCGVLEHFDPPDIVALLLEQSRVSTYVVVDVPNHRCTKPCFGDERFYTDDQWADMFGRAGLRVERTVHRGLDRGVYVGNCSVFLARDSQDNEEIPEIIDVYDHY